MFEFEQPNALKSKRFVALVENILICLRVEIKDVKQDFIFLNLSFQFSTEICRL